MSTDYALGCRKCKVRFWIGQGFRLYDSETDIKRLAEFLHKHRGHPLLFDMKAEEPLVLWPLEK